MKTVRQDADHVVRNAVQQDRTADYVTGTAEPHLPHAVTKHRDGRTMGQILSLRKGASGDRQHAENLEVIGGDVGALHRLRRVARSEVHRQGPEIVDRHCLEHVVLPPHHVLRNRVRIAHARTEAATKLHDPVRLRVRKRLEKNRVDDGENGHICANANRKRRQRNGGKAQIAAHVAERVSQIGQESFHQNR